MNRHDFDIPPRVLKLCLTAIALASAALATASVCLLRHTPGTLVT